MGESYMSGGKRDEEVIGKGYTAIETRKEKSGHGVMPEP
jgi:hypothetical protein